MAYRDDELKRLRSRNEELEARTRQLEDWLLGIVNYDAYFTPEGEEVQDVLRRMARNALDASTPDSEPAEGEKCPFCGGQGRVFDKRFRVQALNARIRTWHGFDEPVERSGLVCCGKTEGDPCFGCPESQRQDAMLERREVMALYDWLYDHVRFDDEDKEEGADKMARLYCALAEPAVPEGWKLVPVEPTQEMDIAGAGQSVDFDACFEEVDLIYEAMLAAAPQPEHGEADYHS